MDYKVLYRKYRPNDFSGIIGQDYMVSILKNSIDKEKISHAYIFSGPRGTGKTSTAKVFAKAINCLNPTESGPCNACESCLNFKENADIIEIDAASNNGVDEIREIINNIKLAPSYSKYKVYIIDEVHMLSTSAFNALLLTLEEPPKHIVFILATTNIEAVPITILSRCQRFDFHKISVDDIIKRLEYVVKEEKIDIDSDALEEIAYISDGGMRDALSILDQLSSNNSKITIKNVISNFGSISKKQVDDMFKCILNNKITEFVEIISKLKSTAVDYKLLIKRLLERIEEEAVKIKSDHNYYSMSYTNIKNMAFELASISNYININVDPYILIEITLLKYFESNIEENAPKNTNQIDRPLKEPTKLKDPVSDIPRELESSKQIERKELYISDSMLQDLKKIRVNNCFVNAKKEYLQNIKNSWPEFVMNLDDKSLLNLLIDSNIIAASDEIAIITNELEGTVNLINEKLENIEEYYNNKYKRKYKFIALSNENWNKEKQIYIQNMKNKVEYKYMEEPMLISEKKAANNIEKQEGIEQTALNIFEKEKIEIE